ncbi:hypothetical protein ACS0TY_022360 [Phlomoides rotata]
MNRFCLSNITYKGVWSNKFEPINVNDDFDVCILEDLSASAVLSNPTAEWKDISQQKTKALPPDGVLAVPLLKHQAMHFLSSLSSVWHLMLLHLHQFLKKVL